MIGGNGDLPPAFRDYQETDTSAETAESTCLNQGDRKPTSPSAQVGKDTCCLLPAAAQRLGRESLRLFDVAA
jgi:hypothetical protein